MPYQSHRPLFGKDYKIRSSSSHTHTHTKWGLMYSQSTARLFATSGCIITLRLCVTHVTNRFKVHLSLSSYDVGLRIRWKTYKGIHCAAELYSVQLTTSSATHNLNCTVLSCKKLPIVFTLRLQDTVLFFLPLKTSYQSNKIKMVKFRLAEI